VAIRILTLLYEEVKGMTQKSIETLLEQYPNWLPVKEAAQLLGVSPRQLSRLITEGREPFCSLGADIGVGQHYCRVYTPRLVRYLSGQDIPDIGA
jgi:transposase